MRKTKSALAAFVIASAIAGGGYAFLAGPMVPSAMAKWHEHPRLEGAFNGLRDAKAYLESAPHDFHGHKAEAIRAIDEAMHQLKICAEEAMPSTPDAPPLAEREHEKLHVAKEHLEDAHNYLKAAPTDFHGHKAEAMRAIEEAQHQIDLCLEK